MGSLFAPCPDSLTWHERLLRQRTLDRLRSEIELERMYDKQTRKREQQAQRNAE